jgi:hypothetical protein
MKNATLVMLILGLFAVGCAGADDGGSRSDDVDWSKIESVDQISQPIDDGCLRHCRDVYNDCRSRGIPAGSCGATASVCLRLTC